MRGKLFQNPNALVKCSLWRQDALKIRSHLYSEKKIEENIKIKARGYDVGHGNKLEGRAFKSNVEEELKYLAMENTLVKGGKNEDGNQINSTECIRISMSLVERSISLRDGFISIKCVSNWWMVF